MLLTHIYDSRLIKTDYKEVATSTPILFTNNKIDPVTSSLETIMAYFPGAGSLYQDAIGISLYALLLVKTGEANMNSTAFPLLYLTALRTIQSGT